MGSDRKKCQLCVKPSVARGLCASHYKRWQRNGHTESTRPSDWGTREKHPLYHSWLWHKKASGLVSEWEDFDTFKESVGDRPEGHHLRRFNVKEKMGPENWYWKEKVSNRDKSEYQRKWREQNPARVKDYDLRRAYGIGWEEYNDLMESQGGECAICRKEEHVKHKGQKRMMAVDHCHTSGVVRGLLCTNCNKGLGHFKDEVEVLERAIEYLRQ